MRKAFFILVIGSLAMSSAACSTIGFDKSKALGTFGKIGTILHKGADYSDMGGDFMRRGGDVVNSQAAGAVETAYSIEADLTAPLKALWGMIVGIFKG